MDKKREFTILQSEDEEGFGERCEIISTMGYKEIGVENRIIIALRPDFDPSRIIFAFYRGGFARPIQFQDDYEKIKEMFVSRWKSEYRNDEDELQRLLEGAGAITREQLEKEDDKITLTMEDGTEADYTIMVTFEYNDKDYVILNPDTDDDDDPFLIYSYHKTENGLELIDVDDDEYDMGIEVLEEFLKSSE